MDLWQFRGACQDHDPEIWFPFPRDAEGEARAKAICLTCPVRGQCLAHAIDREISDGIWGGHTPSERDILAARPRLAPHALPAELVEHGTPGGYMWHRRYSPPACPECHAAERDRGRARRAARRSEMAS